MAHNGGKVSLNTVFLEKEVYLHIGYIYPHTRIYFCKKHEIMAQPQYAYFLKISASYVQTLFLFFMYNLFFHAQFLADLDYVFLTTNPLPSLFDLPDNI